jgi:uncharacterized membrane protein YeaQ/YmgE (transglycosylase-associated protein family)
MHLIAWLVLGLLFGFIGSKIVNKSGAVIGAVVVLVVYHALRRAV